VLAFYLACEGGDQAFFEIFGLMVIGETFKKEREGGL